MTEEDLALVGRFLKEKKIDVLNTRAFKDTDGLVITVGSVNEKEETS